MSGVAGAENESVGTAVAADIAHAAPAQAFPTTEPSAPSTDRELRAMRTAALAAGFGHAIESVAQVVAVEIGGLVDSDELMGKVADEAERAVLDAMVSVACRHGWRGPA